MAEEVKRGVALARLAKRALRRGLLYLARPSSGDSWCEEEGGGDENGGSETCFVPEDVREGHFVVVATLEEEPRRFVVSLRCLSRPRFLQLLARAEEEFGFHQQGALAIPCRSSELESVLGEL